MGLWPVGQMSHGKDHRASDTAGSAAAGQPGGAAGPRHGGRCAAQGPAAGSCHDGVTRGLMSQHAQQSTRETDEQLRERMARVEADNKQLLKFVCAELGGGGRGLADINCEVLG